MCLDDINLFREDAKQALWSTSTSPTYKPYACFIHSHQIVFYGFSRKDINKLNISKEQQDTYSFPSHSIAHFLRKRWGRKKSAPTLVWRRLFVIKASFIAYLTSLTNSSPLYHARILPSVVMAILSVASAVKNAWCDVIITLLKLNKRASVSSSIMRSLLSLKK